MITPGRLAVVAGGLALVLLAAMAGSGCEAVDRLAARSDAAAAVERTAAAFVVQAGSVDPASADRYAAALLPLATGPLQHALLTAVADPRAGARERRATVRVERTVLTALSAEAASVTVVAVQSRRWSDARAGRQQEAVRQWIACRLEAVDGRWLVAELRVLAEEPADPAPAGVEAVD